MRFLERLVWALAILVIVASLYLAWLFRPSPILRIQIPPPRKVDPKQAWARTERSLQYLVRQSTKSGEKGSNRGEVEFKRRVLTRLQALFKKYPAELTRSYLYSDKTLVEKYANWNEALQVARTVGATLIERNGQIVGIRIDSLPADSPLREYVGLQPGDVITSICGELPQARSEAEMVREARALFDRLKGQDTLYLEIERAGRPMLITIHFQR